MKYPDKRVLFTVKDVTHACNISRTTLIRMEECGFLAPYRIDPDTGYRYYDANNITQIGQFQLLQELGLSRKEITEFYFGKTDVKGFLAAQQEKLDRLQRLVNELDIRYARAQDMKFSFIRLPETTCYCVEAKSTSPYEIETLSYASYQQMIQEGFQVHNGEPIFVTLLDDASAAADDKSVPAALMCFPVLPSAETDPHLKTFPACTAFSLIGHGDYSMASRLQRVFSEEIAKRGLTPAGPARIIVLMAPYVGEHIADKDFCFEYVLPVEELLN